MGSCTYHSSVMLTRSRSSLVRYSGPRSRQACKRWHAALKISASSTSGSVRNTLPVTSVEVAQRLKKTCALISVGDQLAPFDPQDFNQALLIWKEIAGIPPGERRQLLGMLSDSDILQLWGMASKRYLATKGQVADIVGPVYSIDDDFPTELNEVVVYAGRAAVPFSAAFGRFSKVFFRAGEDSSLYGRVQLPVSAVSDRLYANYFTCGIAPTVIPDTGEVADMSLDYVGPDQLQLSPAMMPSTRQWPFPQAPRWPFSGGLIDYLRPVGPGVYVGCGWKRAPGSKRGKRFLYFLMVRL